VVKLWRRSVYQRGTVEFLMDEDGSMYFIEMNTAFSRDPVTEIVTEWT